MAEITIQVSDLEQLISVVAEDFLHIKQVEDNGDYKITVEDFAATLAEVIPLDLGDLAYLDTIPSIAGNGLTSTGTIPTNYLLSLGTPSTISRSTTNAVTSSSHTHAIDKTVPVIKGGIILFSGTFIGKNPVPTGETVADTSWHLCLPGDSLVTLADGTKERIDYIVENKLEIEVVSFDENTKQLCTSKVVDWYKNEAKREDWLRIKVANPKGTKKTLTLTKDHPVWTGEDWTEARDIVEGDTIYRQGRSITTECSQALLGMYLGDGSIEDTGRLHVSHGDSQRFYSDYIAKMLGVKVSSRVSTEGFNENKPVHSVKVSLKSLAPDVIDLIELGRKKGCKVTPELLSNLGMVGLAHWYMDDGSLSWDKRYPEYYRANLHTEGFSNEELKIIAEWFKSSFNIDVTEYKRNNTVGKQLSFVGKNSEKLLRMIAPYVLEGFNYKLPESLQGINKVVSGTWVVDSVDPVRVVEVKSVLDLSKSHSQRTKYDTRYDIKVEATHSFIADNFIVHNCDGTNGTPDYRNRVPIGSGDLYPINSTGGSKDAVVVSHTHSAVTLEAGEHTHNTLNSLIQGQQSNNGVYLSRYDNYNQFLLADATREPTSGRTTTSGDHSHAVSVTSSGVVGTDKNLPPYRATAFIMKV